MLQDVGGHYLFDAVIFNHMQIGYVTHDISSPNRIDIYGRKPGRLVISTSHI